MELAPKDPFKKPSNAILFWTLLAGVVFVNIVWVTFDKAPPVWDMAHHQWRGLTAFSRWWENGLLGGFSHISDYYPPLYYLQEGVIFALFGDTGAIALLANLPAMVLTSVFTWRLAVRVMPSPSSEIAGILPLLMPLAAWTSRETLLDLPLTGWVVFAVYLLYRSRWLQVTGWSLIFGLAVIGGMLTKWTFAFFVAPALLWAFLRTSDHVRAARNLLDASLLAMPAVFWWYLPNAQGLLGRLGSTNQAAVAELDPTAWEAAGWIYYPRALFSYYLYLPLALLLATGLFRLVRRRGWNRMLTYAAVWLLGGIALLALLDAKDPRYIMPVAPALALFLMAGWSDRPKAAVAVGVLAAAQYLSVSFGVPGGPYKLALNEHDPPDYRTLSQEWVLYQSSYFNVAGPPRREDWGYESMLDYLPEGAVVGFVPEAPRFHSVALVLRAAHRAKEIRVRNVGLDPMTAESLESYTHFVGKTGSQGLEELTPYSRSIYRLLRRRGWEQIWRYPLPDGSDGIVWQSPP